MNRPNNIKGVFRGDIYYANIEGQGCVHSGRRPVLIYSNRANNIYSPTVNVIPLTKQIKYLCVHVKIEGCGLREPSVVLPEQITTIDKSQLLCKIGSITDEYMEQVDKAVDIQLGRIKPVRNEQLLNDIYGVAL